MNFGGVMKIKQLTKYQNNILHNMSSIPVCTSAKLQELATNPMHHTLGNSSGSHLQCNILKREVIYIQ